MTDILVIVLSMVVGLQIAMWLTMRWMACVMGAVDARIGELEEALLVDEDDPEPERRPACLRVVP
jgi:hypothetical protein